MLSEIQFHHIVNNVLNLACCRKAGLNLLDVDDDPQHDRQTAIFSLGASRHAAWKLENTGNTVWLRTAKGSRIFRLSFNENLTPDNATIAQLENMIKAMSYTLINVINFILSGMYIYQKDPSYYLDYPNIDDFYNNAESSFLAVKLPGEGRVLRLSDADRDQRMNENIADIDYIIVDVVGIRTIPALSPTPDDKKTYSNTFESPLFRIVIKNGVLAYTRYTNIAGIKELNTETGDIDFVQKTPDEFKDFIASTNKPRLSKKTTKIDINKAVNAVDDQEKMNTEPDYKPVELANMIRYDIDHNWTKDDKASAATKFTDVGEIAMIGYRAVLDKHSKTCVRKDPNIKNRIPDSVMVGYALDDYLNCYPIHPNDINIGISRGAEYPVCISYSSPSGIIAELYITPEESLLKDATNLLSKNNFFAVNKKDRILLRYNKGGNQFESEELNNIDTAFNQLRSLIALRSFIDDISRTVYHTLAETQWSEKMLKDEHIATTSVSVNPHEAKVAIHSLVSDIEIPINVMIVDNPSGGAKIIATLNDREFAFSAEKRQSILDQYNIMDVALASSSKRMSTKNKKVAFGNLFGALLSIDIEQSFSQFIQSNRKGIRSMSNENQQANLYNALKFRAGSVLGNLLLDVRDALINTFGKNVIGTPSNPSKVSPVLNISDFNYGVSRPVKTPDGTKYEPVSAAFMLNTCNFAASYDRKTKEPKVICHFGGDDYMRADHIVDGRVTHEFLQWYLLRHPESSVTNKLLRCIENNAVTSYVTDKAGKPTDTIEYQIDPEVVELLAPYARDSYQFKEHPVNRDMSGRAPEMPINKNSILDDSLRAKLDEILTIPDENDENDDEPGVEEDEDLDIRD